MQFTNALAVAAVLTTTVSASPVDNENGFLALRNYGDNNQPHCIGGQKWNGWDKACKCAKSLWYNKQSAKCQYDTFPKPQCNYGEQAYCAASIQSWCPYDNAKAQCWDNGQNKAFCAQGSSAVPGLLQGWYPTAIPACAGGQLYDASVKKCACAKGQQWLNNKCGYPAQPKPACVGGQVAYCARSKQDWCPYDAQADQCQDDGYTVAFCAGQGQAQQWCESKWSASLSVSV